MTPIPPRVLLGLRRLYLPYCVAIVLLTSFWLPKRLLESKCHSLSLLQNNCGQLFQSVQDADDHWSGLQQSVLRFWQALGENTDSTHPLRSSKPQIITQLVKGEGRRNPVNVEEDIVLATHISAHKLDVLLLQLARWGGPASVAVYLTSPAEIQSFFSFWARHRELLTQATFHVALERAASTLNEKPLLYPHNILRNVALETIESNYFVALDVDFIPSPNAYEQLMHYLQLGDGENKESTFRRELRNKRMFVLPAFELFPRHGEQYATADMLPNTKRQVIDLSHNTSLVPFRKGAAVGHMLTNFDKWLGTPSIEMIINNTTGRSFYYEIPLKGNKRREVWEPYVVGYRPGIHRYWEDFRGYGYDKFSFFVESQLAGYTFAALHDLFCVHLDHPEVSKENQRDLLQRNEVHYVNFKTYLREKYGGEPQWLLSSSSSSSAKNSTTSKDERR